MKFSGLITIGLCAVVTGFAISNIQAPPVKAISNLCEIEPGAVKLGGTVVGISDEGSSSILEVASTSSTCTARVTMLLRDRHFSIGDTIAIKGKADSFGVQAETVNVAPANALDLKGDMVGRVVIESIGLAQLTSSRSVDGTGGYSLSLKDGNVYVPNKFVHVFESGTHNYRLSYGGDNYEISSIERLD